MSVLELAPQKAISPHAAALELGRRHLLDFTLLFKPNYQISWHHEVLAHELERVQRGECDRLMVFMPPRHGKSELTTVMLPPWFLGNSPAGTKVISASYSEDLALDFGSRTRDIAASPIYAKAMKKSMSSNTYSKQRWALNDGSTYIATGIGGPITGRGADLAVIDDPIKNQEEAESVTHREAVWRWYQSTLYTRLEKGARIVLILTRWHEDDLAGRLLKEMKDGTGDKWRVIDLPAIADANEEHRLAGEALWPEKYDVPALLRIKGTVGTRYWNALYRQKPSSDEGNILKRAWWKRYDPAVLTNKVPKRIIQSWDTMYGDDELARMQKKTDKHLAMNVCETWAEYDEGYFLIDYVMNRDEFQDLVKTATSYAAQFRPGLVLIEDKATGRSLIQSLRQLTRIPLVAINPGAKSKETRAFAAAPVIEGGRCYVMNGPAGDDFIEFCAAFPTGAAPSADVVDAATQAIRYLHGGGQWEGGQY